MHVYFPSVKYCKVSHIVICFVPRPYIPVYLSIKTAFTIMVAKRVLLSKHCYNHCLKINIALISLLYHKL